MTSQRPLRICLQRPALHRPELSFLHEKALLKPAPVLRGGVFLTGLALALGGTQVGAADVRLGLTSSAGLGCQIAGVRVGIQQQALGLHLQGSFCNSAVPGPSFGGGLSYDLFRAGSFTTYLLAGFDTLPSGTGAVNVGLGLRYSTLLLPVEGYVEAGAQVVSSVFGTIYGPRVTVGVNYRLSVDNLQGTLPPEPSATADKVVYSGTAPAECKLSPTEDAASARGAASSAASSGLSDAASALGAVYSNVSYQVTIGGVSINGNSARVGGTATIQATQVTNGQRVSGSYSGTINLVREDCGWRATGYSRSDQP